MQLQINSVRDFVAICNTAKAAFGEKIPFTDNICDDIQKVAAILQNNIQSPVGDNAIERRLNKELAQDLRARVLTIGELMQGAAVKKEEKMPEKKASKEKVQGTDAIAALSHAMAQVTLQPLVLPPVAPPASLATIAQIPLFPLVHYRDVAVEERAAVRIFYTEEVNEASTRALETLYRNNVDPKATRTVPDYSSGTPTHSELMFSVIKRLLTLLATCHISDERRYEVSNRDRSQSHIFDKYMHGLENDPDEHADYMVYLNAFLDNLDRVLLRVIADNAADALIWCSSKISYPIKESYKNYPPEVYSLIRLLASKTKHSSVSQLFAAAFMDDDVRLSTCLEELKMFAPALMTQSNKHGVKYTLLEVIIAQNSLKCAALLLGRNPKLSRSSALSWQLVQSPEMAALLVKAGILPDPQIFSLSVLPYDTWGVEDPLAYAGRWYQKPKTWTPFLESVTRQCPALLLARDVSGNSVIEALYFGAAHLPTHNAFFWAVVKNGLPLSSKITKDVEAHCLMHGEKKWLEFLPEARRRECALLLDSQDPISSSRLRLEGLCLQLELQLKIHNLDPESIDSNVIVQAYTEKKRIKNCLQTLANSPEKAALQASYNTFVKLYDTAVDRHPIFCKIRAISRALRRVTSDPITTAAQKFLNLWVEGATMENYTLYLRPENWRRVSLSVRTRIAKAATDISDLPKQQRFLKLVHGTNSAALPSILHLGLLRASGRLFAADIAPLTGEGSKSAVNGYNLTGISTAPPHTDWEESAGALTATPLLLSEQFANSPSYYFLAPSAYGKIETACNMLLTPNFLQTAIGKQINLPAFWFELKRAIIRLKMTENLLFMQKTEVMRQNLKKEMASRALEFHKELQECLRVWEAPPAFTVDPTSWMITELAPLVFGSSNFAREKSSKEKEWNQPFPGEIVVKRDLVIDQDIDLIFTATGAIKKVREVFNKHRLQVFSLEAGRYIEMRQMTLGSVTRAQFVEGQSISTALFHHDILPYYTTPFLGAGPSFEEYKKALSKGIIVARETHGPMHASRVGLFGLMGKNIFASKGLKLEVSSQILLATAGLHDAARQGDGFDLWNNESAKIARHYVRDYLFNNKQDQIPPGLLDLVEHSIRDKDNMVHPTVLERVVSDADRFDIVRTLRNPKKEFRVNEVAFMALPQFTDFPIVQLVDEIIAFVRITENPALKLHLEHYSQDYLRDLALIFCFLHAKDTRFPIMESYLKTDMKALVGGATLSPAIQGLLQT